MSGGAKFPIVGIGASAGGIPAMEGFFRGLPEQPGMAFVVVTHLSPGRESLLHDVLARYTALQVIVAQDGAVVERDTVYVMPQNAVLTAKDGALQIRALDVSSRERKPVDIFLS